MTKHYVVSGGGSGIGFAIAKEILKENLGIPFLIGRNQKKLEQASKKLDKCPYLSVDLRQDTCVQEIKNLGLNAAGLVNNAGTYKPSSFDSCQSKDWLQAFQSNFLTAVFLSQALLEPLKKNKGSIVNISSTLGIRPIAKTSAYSASKSALNNLSLSMALELAPDVRVNTVCPGIVNTPIHDFQREDISQWKKDLKEMQPLKRVGEPSDIAPLVVHLLSEKSSWVTGATLTIDGGILLKS